eukprot:jgi/Mesvir1/9437/Mv25166-RA.1
MTRVSPVTGDSGRLLQILYNLVGNCCKFTAQGTVTLSLVEEEDVVWVRVEDTGIGIEEDKLHTVFDAFVQADESIGKKFGGSGIGLSIAKKLVEAQGGMINVTSTLGRGSVFSFSVPRNKAAPYKVKEPLPVVAHAIRLDDDDYEGNGADELRGGLLRTSEESMAASTISSGSTLMAALSATDNGVTTVGGAKPVDPVSLEEGSSRRGGPPTSVSFSTDVRDSTAPPSRLRRPRRSLSSTEIHLTEAQAGATQYADMVVSPRHMRNPASGHGPPRRNVSSGSPSWWQPRWSRPASANVGAGEWNPSWMDDLLAAPLSDHPAMMRMHLLMQQRMMVSDQQRMMLRSATGGGGGNRPTQAWPQPFATQEQEQGSLGAVGGEEPGTGGGKPPAGAALTPGMVLERKLSLPKTWRTRTPSPPKPSDESEAAVARSPSALVWWQRPGSYPQMREVDPTLADLVRSPERKKPSAPSGAGLMVPLGDRDRSPRGEDAPAGGARRPGERARCPPVHVKSTSIAALGGGEALDPRLAEAARMSPADRRSSWSQNMLVGEGEGGSGQDSEGSYGWGAPNASMSGSPSEHSRGHRGRSDPDSHLPPLSPRLAYNLPSSPRFDLPGHPHPPPYHTQPSSQALTGSGAGGGGDEFALDPMRRPVRVGTSRPHRRVRTEAFGSKHLSPGAPPSPSPQNTPPLLLEGDRATTGPKVSVQPSVRGTPSAGRLSASTAPVAAVAATAAAAVAAVASDSGSGASGSGLASLRLNAAAPSLQGKAERPTATYMGPLLSTLAGSGNLHSSTAGGLQRLDGGIGGASGPGLGMSRPDVALGPSPPLAALGVHKAGFLQTFSPQSPEHARSRQQGWVGDLRPFDFILASKTRGGEGGGGGGGGSSGDGASSHGPGPLFGTWAQLAGAAEALPGSMEPHEKGRPARSRSGGAPSADAGGEEGDGSGEIVSRQLSLQNVQPSPLAEERPPPQPRKAMVSPNSELGGGSAGMGGSGLSAPHWLISRQNSQGELRGQRERAAILYSRQGSLKDVRVAQAATRRSFSRQGSLGEVRRGLEAFRSEMDAHGGAGAEERWEAEGRQGAGLDGSAGRGLLSPKREISHGGWQQQLLPPPHLLQDQRAWLQEQEEHEDQRQLVQQSNWFQGDA